MIIGKSLTALGGGGLNPELTVTAPSGSTIDLLQNGIIVDTYTLGASETEHIFVVKVGTYTVRGTLGTKTKSVNVLIDAVGQYSIEIEYSLILYCGTSSGEPFQSLDWQYKVALSSNNAYCTYSQEKIYGTSTNRNAQCREVLFNLQIDFSKYEKLYCLLVPNSSTYNEFQFSVYSTYSSAYDANPLQLQQPVLTQSSSVQEYVVNISSWDSSGYLAVRAKMSGTDIRKVWLE